MLKVTSICYHLCYHYPCVCTAVYRHYPVSTCNQPADWRARSDYVTIRRAWQTYWDKVLIKTEKLQQVSVVMATAYVLQSPSVDGVTKALLKITESKFESQVSSPLMDSILQQSPTRAREDHVISDDIIEGVVEVRMIS